MAKNLSRRGWLRAAVAAVLGPWAARLLGAGSAAAAAPAPGEAAPPLAPVYDVGGPVTTVCYDAVGSFPQGLVSWTTYDVAGKVLSTTGDTGPKAGEGPAAAGPGA